MVLPLFSFQLRNELRKNVTVLYIRFDCCNQEINLKWQLVSVWVDWRALIECEINKVSHSALQRPLNDLHEIDHQGFDGCMLGRKCFLHLVVSVSLVSPLLPSFLPVCFFFSVLYTTCNLLCWFLFFHPSFCCSLICWLIDDIDIFLFELVNWEIVYMAAVWAAVSSPLSLRFLQLPCQTSDGIIRLTNNQCGWASADRWASGSGSFWGRSTVASGTLQSVGHLSYRSSVFHTCCSLFEQVVTVNPFAYFTLISIQIKPLLAIHDVCPAVHFLRKITCLCRCLISLSAICLVKKKLVKHPVNKIYNIIKRMSSVGLVCLIKCVKITKITETKDNLLLLETNTEFLHVLL